ncbi:proline racemase family protein [Priestia filamentosa]|uniref:proline racemase family protein n=1 Tax=Priestia filamentosa TaxID=1402861 RepID=UPI00397875A2
MIFTGHAIEEPELYGYRAIVPTIRGQAWISVYSQYVLDETNPFPDGYTVGDIW